jgi:ABC-type antimicrobial peptide transport system permease subunit
MTFLRLLGRNLLYHWRGNLAVLLGVALGTAVLTGALLVGDSLRGSLRALTLDRLGWVEEAMLPGRLFRAQLASELPAVQSSAVLMLPASASPAPAREAVLRVSGITVLGVDGEFWQEPADSEFWQSDAAEAMLNRSLATLLGVRVGDPITVFLQKAAEVPRESLLGKRKTSDVVQAVDMHVRRILPDEGLARFSLKPTPEPARNIFVPQRFLQTELGLAGKANAVLVAGVKSNLTEALQACLTLDDWGLRLRTPRERALAFFHNLAPADDTGKLKFARWRGRVPALLAKAVGTPKQDGVDTPTPAPEPAETGILTREQVVAFYEQYRPYISLESQQVFVSPPVVAAADAVSGYAKRRSVCVYLADSITQNGVARSYVVVGAVRMGDGKPWPALGMDAPSPGDNIVLIDTPEDPWRFTVGMSADLRYFMEESRPAASAEMQVQAIVPMHGDLDDPDLTPAFPGITDRPDMRSWRPTFPYNPRRITPQDEAYWQRYRATPRAYVNLATAQRMWGQRFGSLTAVQYYGIDAGTLQKELLAKLAPERGGFVFQPLRAQAEQSSAGSTDFGVLFLSFSVFLIAAALLLIGLLVRLNLERRAGEVGLLLAVGWDHRHVRRLLLGEGVVLALGGGVVGLIGALGYGRLMLDFLRANWPGGEGLSFLQLHVTPLSLVYGYVGSLLVSVLTILWATRVLGKRAAVSLLAGAAAADSPVRSRYRWPMSQVIAIQATLAAVALLVGSFFAKSQEARAMSFFGSGALLLVASLAGVWLWLRRTARESTPRPSLTVLGVRNAGRHAVRSLLTVGLLASATFLIVAVESFHKDAHADFIEGDRRLVLVGEATVPLYQDLNSPAMRKELGLASKKVFERVQFYPCRVLGSDDTSCLNLYRPLQPRVLGVPPALLQRWPSLFPVTASWGNRQPSDLDSLFSRAADDNAIAAVLDANTAEWILKKNLGDIIEVSNGHDEPAKLRVVALLQESIFQSEVLIAEDDFRRTFPRQEGASFFLVDCKDATDADVAEIHSSLETALADYAVRFRTPAERLQAYLGVENMYLATFQALGGLGLILGAIGLAIILLRGVWERRAELALLRALGFTPARLAWLVLAENIALLMLGLIAGTASALLAVAPHLAGAGAHVLWLRIGVLLLLVLGTGLLSGALAVATTLRALLVTALRRE